MRLLVTYILMFTVIGESCAQQKTTQKTITHSNDSLKLVNIFNGSFQLADVDATGNIYLLTAGGQLKKLNAAGDSIAVFNDVRRFGNVTQIDVSNPLRPLVYYKNFSTVAILDRLLSFRSTLNLRLRQIFRVNAVTSSYDNNLWLFDEQAMKLRKVNEEGEILLESADLRTVADAVPEVSAILENGNNVFVYDWQKGIFVFDRYAAFLKIIPLPALRSVSVTENSFAGLNNDQLVVYNLETNKSTALMNNFLQDASFAKVNAGKLFVLTKEAFVVYLLP